MRHKNLKRLKKKKKKEKRRSNTKFNETPDWNRVKGRVLQRIARRKSTKAASTCTQPGRATLSSGKRYYSRNWKLSGLLLSLLIPCSRRKSNAFVHTATFLSAKREIPRGLGDTEWRKRGKDAAEVVTRKISRWNEIKKRIRPVCTPSFVNIRIFRSIRSANTGKSVKYIN